MDRASQNIQKETNPTRFHRVPRTSHAHDRQLLQLRCAREVPLLPDFKRHGHRGSNRFWYNLQSIDGKLLPGTQRRTASQLLGKYGRRQQRDVRF